MGDCQRRISEFLYKTLTWADSAKISHLIKTVPPFHCHALAMRVMEMTHGSKTEAAKTLGVDRTTLYRKLEDCKVKG
jgi:DNA-binding protein Fis